MIGPVKLKVSEMMGKVLIGRSSSAYPISCNLLLVLNDVNSTFIFYCVVGFCFYFLISNYTEKAKILYFLNLVYF
jgi:hypothetical protein